MGSKRHACGCSECAESREFRNEVRHGGMDWEVDETELVPYRKKRRKTYRKKNKPCAKSKTGEKCDFTVRKVRTSWTNRTTGETTYDYIMTCSRCGKHDWRNWLNNFSWYNN